MPLDPSNGAHPSRYLSPTTGGTRSTPDTRQRLERWANLSDRRLRAVASGAATRRDPQLLWELTSAYLTLHGGRGTALSPSTQRSYLHGIRTLVGAWAKVDLLAPNRDAGPLYARLLESRGLSPTSIGVRLSAARQLYRALRWSGATHVDPFDQVRPPVDRTAPWDRRAPYSQAEVVELLRHADAIDSVVVLLGAHGGLRASEMVELQWSQVSFIEARFTVYRGKGEKTRVVNLSGSLRAALEKVEHSRAYVLPCRSYSRLAKRMYRLCDRAGVPRRGLHALRHTAGTEVMRRLGDLESVARHLGHTNLETARVYAKWSDDRLRAELAEW